MITLSRGDEIEADFYQLKAQEWDCSRDEAKLRVVAALYPDHPSFTVFWQPPLGETLVGITVYQDMVIAATDRTIYLIHEQGRSFDHTVIAAIAQKDWTMPYPIILNGDHAEFESEHRDTPPHERPDWPLPSFDALDWAKAFCKINPNGPAEDVMVSWFANALMRGYDEHAARARNKG